VFDGSGETVIYVDDDAEEGGDGSYEDPYIKIQDAIDASEPGNIIYIFNGSYPENIEVSTSLILEGESRESVVIEGDGESDDSLVAIRDCSDVTVWNLTILPSESSPTSGFSGLAIVDSERVSVHNVSISECGNGIFVKSGSGCEVADVSSNDNSRHGLNISNWDEISVSRSVFNGNGRYGVFVLFSTTTIIEDCTCGDGDGKGNNYGITVDRSDYTIISDCSMKENDVMGIYIYRCNFTNIYNCTVAMSDIGIKDQYSNGTSVTEVYYSSNTYSDYFVVTNNPPAAHLKSDTTKAETGQNISFNATASGDANDDTPVTWYRMDFGDGAVTGWRSDPYFDHSYDSAGEYTATLHVKDSLGLESEQPDVVNITIENDFLDDDPAFGAAPAVAVLMAVSVVMAIFRKRR